MKSLQQIIQERRDGKVTSASTQKLIDFIEQSTRRSSNEQKSASKSAVENQQVNHEELKSEMSGIRSGIPVTNIKDMLSGIHLNLHGNPTINTDGLKIEGLAEYLLNMVNVVETIQNQLETIGDQISEKTATRTSEAITKAVKSIDLEVHSPTVNVKPTKIKVPRPHVEVTVRPRLVMPASVQSMPEKKDEDHDFSITRDEFGNFSGVKEEYPDRVRTMERNGDNFKITTKRK